MESGLNMEPAALFGVCIEVHQERCLTHQCLVDLTLSFRQVRIYATIGNKILSFFQKNFKGRIFKPGRPSIRLSGSEVLYASKRFKG